MALIHFVKDRPPVPAPADRTLMETLRAAGLPVASSCLGDGVCGKCRVRVLTGEQNLSPENEVERRRREQLRYPRGERLACQTVVRGDVTVDTTYW